MPGRGETKTLIVPTADQGMAIDKNVRDIGKLLVSDVMGGVALKLRNITITYQHKRNWHPPARTGSVIVEKTETPAINSDLDFLQKDARNIYMSRKQGKSSLEKQGNNIWLQALTLGAASIFLLIVTGFAMYADRQDKAAELANPSGATTLPPVQTQEQMSDEQPLPPEVQEFSVKPPKPTKSEVRTLKAQAAQEKAAQTLAAKRTKLTRQDEANKARWDAEWQASIDRQDFYRDMDLRRVTERSRQGNQRMEDADNFRNVDAHIAINDYHDDLMSPLAALSKKDAIDRHHRRLSQYLTKVEANKYLARVLGLGLLLIVGCFFGLMAEERSHWTVDVFGTLFLVGMMLYVGTTYYKYMDAFTKVCVFEQGDFTDSSHVTGILYTNLPRLFFLRRPEVWRGNNGKNGYMDGGAFVCLSTGGMDYEVLNEDDRSDEIDCRAIPGKMIDAFRTAEDYIDLKAERAAVWGENVIARRNLCRLLDEGGAADAALDKSAFGEWLGKNWPWLLAAGIFGLGFLILAMVGVSMNPRTIAYIVIVAVFLMVAAFAGVVVTWNTVSNIPLQMHVTDFPTPAPTHTPVPTPTMAPTIPAHNIPLLRVAQKYDTLTTDIGAGYQRGTNAFTESDFTGRDAAGSPSHTITIPMCRHDTGFPWTRYSIAWPIGEPVPTDVIIGGIDQIAAFVLQTNLAGTSNMSITIGGNNYYLMVSAGRINCQLMEGTTWIVR